MQTLRLLFDGDDKVSLRIPNTCLWVNDFNCSIANSDSFQLVQKSILDFISASEFVPWENLAEYDDNAIEAEDAKKHLLTTIENAENELDKMKGEHGFRDVYEYHINVKVHSRSHINAESRIKALNLIEHLKSTFKDFGVDFEWSDDSGLK